MKTSILQYPILITIFCLALFSFDANAQEVEPDLSRIKPATTITPQNPSISLIDYIRRIPGVTVMSRRGSFSVKLRGTNSFQGTSSPLYILDGRYIRSFDQLNKTVEVIDIAKIDVLKGADATTRYGIRAGNGALVIRTK